MNMIETTFTTVRDRICMVAQKNEQPAKFRIYALSDKVGTMKNGEKAPYVVLLNDDGATVVNLHPEHAKRLFKKGEDSGITMTEEVYKAAEEVVEEVAAVIEQPVIEQPTASTEEGQQQAAADAAPVADKPLTKKAQAITIFNANVGKARKEVIAQFKDQLGMSDQGGATYYHNIKSGLWK